MNNKIFFNCILTDFYLPLYEKFFIKSFDQPQELLICHKFCDCFGGGFETLEFLKTIEFKLEKIIQSLSTYQIVIWSDVDLFFCQKSNLIINDLFYRLKDFDLMFTRENFKGPNINTGFFIARSSCLNLFVDLLESVRKNHKSEQPLLQSMLKNKNYKKIKWGILPKTYWNSSLNCPIPDNVFLVHANLITPKTGFGFLNWCKNSNSHTISDNYINLKLEALTFLKKNFLLRKVKLF